MPPRRWLGWLATGAEELAAPLGGAPTDPVKLDQAVVRLRRYSLLDATDQVLGVHRLVQAVVRHRLGADGERIWAASAVRLVNARPVRRWSGR